MDYLEKIRNLRELEMKKYRLEKELGLLKEEIVFEKENCLHVTVNLGNYGHYPNVDSMYCCLICGMRLGKEHYISSEHVVDASDYMLQYDINEPKQCSNKLAYIQTLVIGIVKENPNISREELVVKLNEVIQESITISNKKREYTRCK